jgi:IclR family transcriptional regulator, blcABC operon repressor
MPFSLMNAPLRRLTDTLTAATTVPPARAAAPVPAVARAVALLDLLAAQGEPMSVTRLAARLDLPKSSVHGLCHTLAAAGLLRRQDDGNWFIGPAVMGLAHAFMGRTTPAQEFDALWQELAAPPEDTVILSVLDGIDVVYVAARNGDRPLGLAFRVGMRLPAHLAASGRAMLAWSDEATLRALGSLGANGRLPAYRRGAAPMTMKALQEELQRTRERGFSIDDEGIRAGVYCIGAPVFDASGRAVAGIGVCIHKGLLDARAEARHRAVVADIARQLTHRLGGAMPRERAAAS